jgi:acyl-CoA synthetase (NDP forming)/GNAT superfamily N-acetyltransferase
MIELATSSYALLTDGTEVEIRPLRPADVEAVRRMHQQMSRESLYLRFFGFNRHAADQVADLMCRPAGPGHAAVSAWLAGELVGVAGYEPDRERADAAELALAVADRLHHRGVGTLLLEHLASLARAQGLRALRADVLAQNHPMLRVIADAGLEAHRDTHDGVVELTLALEPGERYLDSVAARERRADVASLTHLLRPSSVAVVGAGRRPGSVGHAILRSLRTCGFSGDLYAVNPHAGDQIMGVPCAASVTELPEPPELAVVTVPAAQVAEVARACGRRGTRALVVVTAGLDETASHELREACRRYGMRLVGPNCLGIANTGESLNATFAPRHPARGGAGIVVQSGGVGIALLEQLSRLGIGISSFVSAGDKYDVSANDLLQWWESDGLTRLGILHLESFGNPRKFARTASRVARGMPLLTVVAGRSAAGRRAVASHTAAAATPTVTQEALFAQAGVVATHSLGDLVGAAALLGAQPVPAGPRVAIVSNAGGAGVLAADACGDAGLTVAVIGEETRAELARLLPAAAVCGNPVDTTAAIETGHYRRCLDLLAADDGVDAVIAVICPTAVSDPTPGLSSGEAAGEAAGGASAKPLTGVVLDQPENVVMRDGVPCYSCPEDAAHALGLAWSYGRWLARPAGTVPVFDGLRREAAKDLITAFLRRCPAGGWLPPAEAMTLLGHYGLPVADWCWAESADAAARACVRIGGPVAMKAQVPGVIHKTDAGAVRLGLRGQGEVRDAYHRFQSAFGDDLQGVLIQPMQPDGLEALCGVVQEPVFGPLVLFGLGGTATDALADRTARLTPLTDTDAAEMVRSLRAASLVTGEHAHVAVGAIEDVLLRLGQLADDHPEIAELDVNPVIVSPDAAVAVDARVRVAPYQSWDPYLRRLR